ncbi:MAG: hypothetical protein QOJ80_5286 [Mycobacterium sp.]|nr:hypothetical protein [Mycobacterium sp.]
MPTRRAITPPPCESARPCPRCSPSSWALTPWKRQGRISPAQSGSACAAECTANTTSCCTARCAPAKRSIPGRDCPRCARRARAHRWWCTSSRWVRTVGWQSNSGGRWCCWVWTASPTSGPCPPNTASPSRHSKTHAALQHVAEDTARRYAEVSGDWSAHHFDIDVARSAGFDFLFAHGLCTMAMCTHRVLDVIGVGDPGRVRRVAVRFASPTRLGGDLTVRAYGAGEGVIAFDAACADVTVVTNGRLELCS